MWGFCWFLLHGLLTFTHGISRLLLCCFDVLPFLPVFGQGWYVRSGNKSSCKPCKLPARKIALTQAWTHGSTKSWKSSRGWGWDRMGHGCAGSESGHWQGLSGSGSVRVSSPCRVLAVKQNGQSWHLQASYNCLCWPMLAHVGPCWPLPGSSRSLNCPRPCVWRNQYLDATTQDFGRLSGILLLLRPFLPSVCFLHLAFPSFVNPSFNCPSLVVGP